MLKYWIYSLALLYFIIFVYAVDSAEDCDEDDLECLEDFTTSVSTSFIASSSTSFVTSSSFSFGEPLSTVLAANKADIISDFHEAQLVKQKPNINNLGGKGREILPTKENSDQAGSVQDKYNQGQVIDSGSAGLDDSINESTATGLSKVEAGILSACGILVVAGIAVGIFVWKNTTKRRNFRNQDMSITDLEYNHDLDMNGGDPMAIKNSITTQMPKAVIEPSIASEEQQQHHEQNDNIESANSSNSENLAIIQKQLQQGLHEEERLQLQQLKQQNTVDLSLPAIKRDEDDFLIMWEKRNSKHSFKNKPTEQEISDQHLGTKDETVNTSQLPKFEHSLFTSEENEVLDPINNKTAAIETVYNQSNVAGIIQPNSIAAANVDLSSSEMVKEYEMSDLSPGLQANTAAGPSILDPAHDPTAITYPLQKFLNIPTQSFKSPIQIPVELGDNDQEEEEDTVDEQPRQQQISLDKQDVFGDMDNNEKTVASSSVQNLSQQLNKIFRQPESHFKLTDEKDSLSSFTKETTATSQNDMVVIDLAKDKLKEKAPLSAMHTTEDETEHGKQPFLSPLDLPDDQYIPMRDAAGPPLVSRAEVLADPIRRLGEDEIALWEHNCRKKELKRLSYEMWDEQMLREKIEINDKKQIECYYGEQIVESKEEEGKVIP
ncbi:hypothetical protein INT46_002501 [Mucor plumbeus]|uniref:Uncharacterized protein n=1 Tax=Mucor plumbeus TaxID=97098 RepID=A0A8H7R2B4_9FUNG|nr:hypothetical protein INT46_002501 [Mucor plumbeus]